MTTVVTTIDACSQICAAFIATGLAIPLMRNSGQHNALQCGIRAARYGLIVTLDDDLQNPPEEIPQLLEALDERLDVVYGAPPHGVHGLWRNLASQMTLSASTMPSRRRRHSGMARCRSWW
jgi:glycosyltransferase involved in cell wall biosynthesis